MLKEKGNRAFLVNVSVVSESAEEGEAAEEGEGRAAV